MQSNEQTIIAAIHNAAKAQGIDPLLFEAICRIESSLDPYAVRFEKDYLYLFEVRENAARYRLSIETEGALQKFSYGLAQIMGAVCREYGYKSSLVHLATDWQSSLKYSAKHLAKFLKKYPLTSDAIASYNAGSPRRKNGFYVNQSYVDKVLAAYEKLNLKPALV